MLKVLMFRCLTIVWLCLLSLVTYADDDECKHSYQFKIKTNTKFDFQTTAMTRHRMNGVLSLRELLPSSNPLDPGVWWGMQLSDTSQEANGEHAPLDPIYSIPFAVFRRPDGSLSEFYFPGKWPKEETDKLKGFAYYLQFAKAEVRRSEEDTIGRYEALYSLENNGSTVLKNKLAYQNSDNVSHLERSQARQSNRSATQAFEKIEVKASTQKIDTSNCWFISTRGEESLYLEGMGQAYEMATEQKYSILNRLQLAEVALWDLPLDHRKWSVKTEEKKLSEKELQVLRAELINTLSSTDFLELRGSELGRLLEKYDQAINTILDMMLESKFSDAQLKRLFNALGQMDTPNSNALLLTAISDSGLDEENRFRAMRAITQGTSPLTPDMTEQMLNLLHDQEFEGSASLRGAALMALGAVVQRREYNEESDVLLSAIESQMTPEAATNERAALAASLGNTGNPDVLDTLSRFTHDEHDRVRANVATSLGQINHPGSKGMLYDMVVSEKDNKPLQAAVHALRHFELGVSEIDSVVKVAQESHSERTRSYAIKTLSTQKHRPDQVKSALKKLMKTEPNKRNFVQAAKALTELKQSSAPNN